MDTNKKEAQKIKNELIERREMKLNNKRINSLLFEESPKKEIYENEKNSKTTFERKKKQLSVEELIKVETERQLKAYSKYLKANKKRNKLIKKGKLEKTGYRGI